MVEKKEETEKKSNVEDLKVNLKNLLNAFDKKESTEKEIREAATKAGVSLGKFVKVLFVEKGEEFRNEVGSKAESLFKSAMNFTTNLANDIVEKAEDVVNSLEKNEKATSDESKKTSSDESNKKSEDELNEIRSKTMNISYINLVKAGFCIMTAGKIVSEISRDMYDRPLGNPQCEKLYANYEAYEDVDDALKHTKELAAAMLDMAKK